ncbi:MAG TPA: hypothetical protein VFD10_08530 [Atribacterota bacterium]|nr:hypothetical protein [Atribacterota bacterium]
MNIQKKPESISGKDIRKLIERAYRMLIEKDGYLLKVDANERSITHRLAIYLEVAFPEYDIDCEYNRDGFNSKRLIGYKKQIDSDDTSGTTVYPDIIIHHRGEKCNFIVIEAKKLSNTDDSDKEKLDIYKSELLYKYAYFVKFPVGEDFKNYKCLPSKKFIEEVK